MRLHRVSVPLTIALLAAACAGSQQGETMSFFITSAGPGDGANLGGLEGADQHCTQLAESAGVTGKTWRAYLSTVAMTGQEAVNARDRIGDGPWYNAKGVLVANDLDQLHSESNMLGKETSLSETGAVINGRGDSPNMHDILTGSTMDGRASSDTTDTTCSNWTANGDGSAMVGHHDRQGGGANPTSWNSAHATQGCSAAAFVNSGGRGSFYCFAM